MHVDAATPGSGVTPARLPMERRQLFHSRGRALSTHGNAVSVACRN